VVRNNKKSREREQTAETDAPPSSRSQRVTKIARLLGELAELMGHEDVGKESLHHLRQLQMRVRFSLETHQDKPNQQPVLPAQAPAKWRERSKKSETPLEFIAREYGQWLGKGLTRAHLRQLDMSLYDALKHWLRSNTSPPGFDLPTKYEMVDRQVSQQERLPVIHTPEQRERLRLNQAARRRTTKKGA
jgi:hypothetical protein